MGKLTVERNGDWVSIIELHELGGKSGKARISIAELPRLMQDLQNIYMPDKQEAYHNLRVRDMPPGCYAALEFANLVAAIMKQNGFSFDEALQIMSAQNGNGSNG
jgi:hypothetical protein